MGIKTISGKSNPAVVSRLGMVWAVTLLVSSLPDMLWQTLAGSYPAWLAWAKLGLLILLVFASIRVEPVRSFRHYFLMLAIINFGYWANSWLRQTPGWAAWEANISWPPGMAAIQLLEFGIALIALAVLFILRFRRRQLFLTGGQLDAKGDPIPWLGIKKPTSWVPFALIFAGASFAGALLFSWMSAPPAGSRLSQVLPIIPWILLIAASNGVNEEIIYRSAIFPTLDGRLDKYQMLLLTSIFFGLAHAAGTFPVGLIWAGLAAFQGWIYGKAMLETRGFFWPWFMHAIADIPVFFFSAIVSKASLAF